MRGMLLGIGVSFLASLFFDMTKGESLILLYIVSLHYYFLNFYNKWEKEKNESTSKFHETNRKVME